MARFFICPICKLTLPYSVMEVVEVPTPKGIRRIAICSNCKKRKMKGKK